MENTDIKRPEELKEILRRKVPEATAPAASLAEAIFHTRIAPLDALFPDGGMPFGQLIEITGDISSGKTSLLFRLLASITRTDTAAYLDLPHTFFPAAAVTGGVDITQLFVAIPKSLPAGLRTAELLLNHRLVRGVVLDLVGQKADPNLSQTLLHRLRQETVRSRAMVFFLTENDHAGLITPSTVSLRLEVSRIRDSQIAITVTKSRLCREGVRIEVDLNE